MQHYESGSMEDTLALASRLAREAEAGEVYLLEGDLGVGKTVFAKGFAEGLGVTEMVTSPTFTIVQEYHSGRLPLYHFDLYRIEDPEELIETGVDDYFHGEGVCLVEWPEVAGEYFPENVVRITIAKDLTKGTDHRDVTVDLGRDR